MKPKVSIITPTFDHESFIDRCIESVLAQGFGDWEMLIVDDGSTDGTVEVIGQYTDERIHLIPEKNRGISRLAETYNLALHRAKGDLVAILEGDDYWPPHKLELQIEDFEAEDCVLSWGRAVQVDEQGTAELLMPCILPPIDGRINIPVGKAGFYMMAFQWLTFAFPVTVVMRAEALHRIGGFQQPPGMDFLDLPTFMLLSLEGSWRYHPDILGYWRRHTKSTTRSRYPAMVNACYRWTARFSKEQRERIPANQAEMDDLDLTWNRVQKDRCLCAGRKAASEGRGKDAAEFFQRATQYRVGARTRAMAKVAARMARLGLSPEVAFRLGRQPDWRTLSVGISGDPIIDETLSPADFELFDLRS